MAERSFLSKNTAAFWRLCPKPDFNCWKFNATTLKIEVNNLFKGVFAQSYHRGRLWDASEKEEVSDEEADAQVQVDGGAGSLDGAAELKRQDAEYEAQQWDGQPELGRQPEPKGVLGDKGWHIHVFSVKWEVLFSKNQGVLPPAANHGSVIDPLTLTQSAQRPIVTVAQFSVSRLEHH